MNEAKLEVALSDQVADLTDVYGRHGVPLRYRRISELSEEEQKEPRVYVVPRRWLRSPPAKVAWLNGARTAYASGWCSVYNFTRTYGLDAQFPLSDHADFGHLLEFTAHCRPRRVYTVFSHAGELAKEITRRLKIKAEPLRTRKRREDAIFG